MRRSPVGPNPRRREDAFAPSGLSTRDIEELFVDETGCLLLSRTAVSEITERLWGGLRGFASQT
jgi:hypothetical protein